MTRLLFLPNDQTFLLLDSPLTPDTVMEAVQSGRWTPPEPYGSLLARSQNSITLQAFRQGTLVVITTSYPLELETATAPASSGAAHSPAEYLTGRQADVLNYMTEGLTTKQIALRMGLQPRTVLMHVAALKRRLGANTRAQTVMNAAVLGLCRTGIHHRIG